jgi:hypothetical protein
MPDNASGVVYGTIAVGTLLAAETAQRETYAETVASVVVALALYWLAHSYAEYAAHRIGEGERVTRAELLRTMGQELWIVAGAAVPLLVLLVGWVAGAGLTNAVTAAIWTSAALIVIYELVAGLRAQLSGRDLAAQIAFGAALGLLVIALKIILH